MSEEGTSGAPAFLPLSDDYFVVDGEMELEHAYGTIRRPGATNFNAAASRVIESTARAAGLPDARPLQVWTVLRHTELLLVFRPIQGTNPHRLNWYPQSHAHMTLRVALRAAGVTIEEGINYRVPIRQADDPHLGPVVVLPMAEAVAVPIVAQGNKTGTRILPVSLGQAAAAQESPEPGAP